jgi:hypothetical protein
MPMTSRSVALAAATTLAAIAMSGCAAGSADDSTDLVQSEIVAPTASEWIYRSALVSPWADGSSATRDLANPWPVANGSTRSISASFGPGQSLSFVRSSIAASDYEALVLQVNAGANRRPALQVRAVLDTGATTAGVDLGSTCTYGYVPRGGWTNCNVRFASLAPAGANVTGIVVQEMAGKTLAKMYFDSIGLKRVAPSPTPTPTPTPTPACVPESDTALCASLGVTCGSASGTDNCGAARTVTCGSACPTPTPTPACVPESAAALCASLGVTCGSASGTDNCGAARTVTCGSACPAPTPTPTPASGKESWVWVYTDYANTLAAITANKAAFTHVSPTFYTVNYAYKSGVAYYSTCPNISYCTGNSANAFDGMTTKQFTDKVKALGLRTVPAIYGGSGNSGTDDGIKNLLDNTGGAGDAFIAAMTTEAVNNGYDGYNIDWEIGATIDGTYADKFVAFANKFKAALGPHGMSLSVDAIVSNVNGTWCSGNSGFLDFPKLAASSIDRIIIEDYVDTLGKATASCQGVVMSTASPAACDFSFTGELNMMCSPNLPIDKAVIGLMADPTATNPIAGTAFSTLQSYGFTRVAVWPQYPFMNTSGIKPAGASWYSLLQTFLTH